MISARAIWHYKRWRSTAIGAPFPADYIASALIYRYQLSLFQFLIHSIQSIFIYVLCSACLFPTHVNEGKENNSRGHACLAGNQMRHSGFLPRCHALFVIFNTIFPLRIIRTVKVRYFTHIRYITFSRRTRLLYR